MQKKQNRFKKLKVKIIKREKKKKKTEEIKKINSTELQKPNLDAEIYNINKKCD